MRKAVYIHVGLPKTGTTTIQHYLRDSETNLRAAGYLYPGAADDPSFDGEHNHHLMMNAMTGRLFAPSGALDVAGCRAVVEGVFRKLRETPSLHSLIWSQEAIGMAAPRWDRSYLADLFRDLDVTFVVVIRFTDDWIESLYREMVWSRAGRRAADLRARPIRRISDTSVDADREADGELGRRSALDHGMSISHALRAMSQAVPDGKIRVMSYDAAVQQGRLVSSLLETFGLGVDGAFSQADESAGKRNPTKSTALSMFLYQLITSDIELAHVQSVGQALRRRGRRGESPEALKERRFRFLPPDAVLRARASYEALRTEFGHLPEQPPFADARDSHFMTTDEALDLLKWLRPDLEITTFRAARHAIVRRDGH